MLLQQTCESKVLDLLPLNDTISSCCTLIAKVARNRDVPGLIVRRHATLIAGIIIPRVEGITNDGIGCGCNCALAGHQIAGDNKRQVIYLWRHWQSRAGSEKKR